MIFVNPNRKDCYFDSLFTPPQNDYMKQTLSSLLMRLMNCLLGQKIEIHRADDLLNNKCSLHQSGCYALNLRRIA